MMRRKGIKRIVFGLILLGTAVALGYAVIDFYGRRDWDETKRELLAKGEPLSLAEMAPPKVPYEENFYATDYWREVFRITDEWKARKITFEAFQDGHPFRVLRSINQAVGSIQKGGLIGVRVEAADLEGIAIALEKQGAIKGASAAEMVVKSFEPVEGLLEKIAADVKRTGAYSPIDYKTVEPMYIPMDHLTNIMELARAFRIHAAASMAVGNSMTAARDIETIFRLGANVGRDPFFIAKMVQASCLTIGLHAFWEATARGTWTLAELEEIQKILADPFPAENLVEAFRTERGALNQWKSAHPTVGDYVKFMKLAFKMTEPPAELGWESSLWCRIYPTGLGLMDQAYFNRAIQGNIDAIRSGSVHEVERADALDIPPAWRYPLSRLTLPALSGAGRKYVDLQNRIRLAQATCALERYRLAAGRFPADLTALVPDYLPAVPVDMITLKPIEYQLSGPESYILSSKFMPGSQQPAVEGGQWKWTRRLQTGTH